jgi:hypothetical protein
VPTNAALASSALPTNGDRYAELGRLFAGVLDRSWEIYQGQKPAPKSEPVVITGASLGLPGTEHIFDDSNVERILRGDQFITQIPAKFRQPCWTNASGAWSRAIRESHIRVHYGRG